ncbi:hypothetical protein, partial [Vibrio sp. 10N.239.312.D08]|uniref:hypothetical protein n=1 Tax=Vibrio sp. 10N.239.312.D08 TaxID=3229978 RepID=UPI00354CB8E8
EPVEDFHLLDQRHARRTTDKSEANGFAFLVLPYAQNCFLIQARIEGYDNIAALIKLDENTSCTQH